MQNRDGSGEVDFQEFVTLMNQSSFFELNDEKEAFGWRSHFFEFTTKYRRKKIIENLQNKDLDLLNRYSRFTDLFDISMFSNDSIRYSTSERNALRLKSHRTSKKKGDINIAGIDDVLESDGDTDSEDEAPGGEEGDDGRARVDSDKHVRKVAVPAEASTSQNAEESISHFALRQAQEAMEQSFKGPGSSFMGSPGSPAFLHRRPTMTKMVITEETEDEVEQLEEEVKLEQGETMKTTFDLLREERREHLANVKEALLSYDQRKRKSVQEMPSTVATKSTGSMRGKVKPNPKIASKGAALWSQEGKIAARSHYLTVIMQGGPPAVGTGRVKGCTGINSQGRNPASKDAGSSRTTEGTKPSVVHVSKKPTKPGPDIKKRMMMLMHPSRLNRIVT